MSKFPRVLAQCLLAPSLLVATIAGCTGGGGLGLSNEVIVRNDDDPYNLDAAQRIADRQCAARGAGGAQFVLLQNNARSAGGQGGGGSGGPPDIIYRCLPAGSARS
jgi:hypothetical protein